jgi:hypothetical protein
MLTVITGWRPRRTIIFASWDAEEFGLLGSTEWAEVNKPGKVLLFSWSTGIHITYVSLDIYLYISSILHILATCLSIL